MTIFIRNLKNNKKLILVNNPLQSAIYFDGAKSEEKAVSEIMGVTDKEKDRILGSLYVALRSQFFIEEKPVHIRKCKTTSVMIQDEKAGIILMSRDNNRWTKFTNIDVMRSDMSKQGFKITPEYVAMRFAMNHLWNVDLRIKRPISLYPLNGLMVDLETGGITRMGNYKGEVIWNE
jgi:hypothetical protein